MMQLSESTPRAKSKHHVVLRRSINLRTVLLIALVLVGFPSARAQSKFKVLHAFGTGSDGAGVWDSVAFDTKGNLYGTTSGGGAYGWGAVFELTPTRHGPWTETVLQSFMLNDPNGSEPLGGVISDTAGNLYGATARGGMYQFGTIFELTPGSDGWTFAVLYDFGTNSNDGGGPFDSLVMDKAGDLYGTTGGGGTYGGGTIFELTPGSGGWTESLPYSFGANGGVGGTDPDGGLILDAMGNLYGVTNNGGDLSCPSGYGCGVVFELVRGSGGSWTEHVLHSFTGFANPQGTLAFDSAGNLYGTTLIGGGTGCTGGCGTVYTLTHRSDGKWSYTVLHQFGNGANGNTPVGGVVLDTAGNLYGATGYGGTGCGCGVVYKLTPTSHGPWTYSILHTFTGQDGAEPAADLIWDTKGNLYGTTATGGSGGGGVVFELTP